MNTKQDDEQLIKGLERIEAAKTKVVELIEKSDKVEVELIDIKQALDTAEYCFMGAHAAAVANIAGLDVDKISEEYLQGLS